MAGSSHSGQSLFEQLVEGLASSLQFEAGLTADGDVKRMMQLMDKYVSRESDWRAYAFADYSRAYTRNLVDAGNGESNLLILVWTPGKSSPIHDHANSHCLMKVLKGSLIETLYDWPDCGNIYQALQTKKISVYEENRVTYMADDLGLHQISNGGSDQAVSLHCQ